jgi:hypothetical protein
MPQASEKVAFPRIQRKFLLGHKRKATLVASPDWRATTIEKAKSSVSVSLAEQRETIGEGNNAFRSQGVGRVRSIDGARKSSMHQREQSAARQSTALCANNRETGALQKISDETEQGETDMNNGKCVFIVDRRVGDRSDGQSDKAAVWRRVRPFRARGAPNARTLERSNARTLERQRVLDAAFEANPERFTRGRPLANLPPAAAWISEREQAREATSTPTMSA